MSYRLPSSSVVCHHSRMKRLLLILLTLVVLLFNPTEGWSADFQKGWDAAQRGDYATALREWKPLAEQGNANAQFNLGSMYEGGYGVPRDYVKAYMWINLAAANGNENGAKLRDNFAKVMTPSQIEKAQDLSRECVRKNYKGC